MTVARLQFPFVMRERALGPASLVPMLPLTLAATKSVAVSGLLDTGATVNVLPYASGVELGFDWDRRTTSVRLGGNLAIVEARAVAVSAVVGDLAPVRLAFAWAHSDDVPVILGQVNFFLEFDVCFFQSRRIFEIPTGATTVEDATCAANRARRLVAAAQSIVHAWGDGQGTRQAMDRLAPR